MSKLPAKCKASRTFVELQEVSDYDQKNTTITPKTTRGTMQALNYQLPPILNYMLHFDLIDVVYLTTVSFIRSTSTLHCFERR